MGILQRLRSTHRDAAIDVGLFGATVSTATQAPAFLQAMGVTRDEQLKRITLGSHESYVRKLTNKFVYCPASDMLQALVHTINAHPKKKHFVFFNSATVLHHVKALLNAMMEGRRPLVHTGRVFALHEGMKDSAKYAEFGRFLKYSPEVA